MSQVWNQAIWKAYRTTRVPILKVSTSCWRKETRSRLEWSGVLKTPETARGRKFARVKCPKTTCLRNIWTQTKRVTQRRQTTRCIEESRSCQSHSRETFDRCSGQLTSST